MDVILLEEIREIVRKEISSGGGVKSVQRGTTTAAGNITINEVNPDKAAVLSVSKGSAGYVAARGNLKFWVDQGSGSYYGGIYEPYHSSGSSYSASSLSINKSRPGIIEGGSTDLTVKQYSAKLINATTLSCDGPVEWQVIEYA